LNICHPLKELKNATKEAGDFLRLRCEVDGDVPATSFEWFKNGAPLIEEKNRVKAKTKLKDSPQWTQLRIRDEIYQIIYYFKVRILF
jgi:hypothetical protein